MKDFGTVKLVTPPDYPGCKYTHRIVIRESFMESVENRKRLDTRGIDYISGGDSDKGIYTFTNEKDAFWFSMGH